MSKNAELPYCVHRYEDGSVCGKLAKNFWHLHSKVNDKRHHAFLSSETYALVTEQSYREPIMAAARKYAEPNTDKFAGFIDGAAWALNYPEQTVQAFRLSKSRIDKIVEDLIDGPVTLAAFDDGDGGETHIDRSACWAVFRANGIAVDE